MSAKLLVSRRWLLHLLPWVAALLLALVLFLFMIYLQGAEIQKKQSVTVRKIDVALPPPPPPPPPLEMQSNTSESEPAIDLLGAGEGPELEFSSTPKMGLSNLNVAEKPSFDFNSIDLDKSIKFEIPTLDVKNLDGVPKAISYKSVKYPRTLVERGIKRVDTKVEIIIDQKGKAYIKKIVDPVYPEMVDVIRDWVAGVRFTVPTKNGKPVQAIYLYTIQFIYRV